jgi:hypothetical protein
MMEEDRKVRAWGQAMAEAALDPDLYRAIDDLLVLRALAEGDE